MEGPSKKAAAYSPTVAVPSALTGLTSLFGMVRGGPRRHGHPKPLAALPRPQYLDTLEKDHMKKQKQVFFAHKKRPHNRPTGY